MFHQFGLFIAVLGVLLNQIYAVGDKPWPITGKRDESLQSLTDEVRNKITAFTHQFHEVTIDASDGIKLKAITFDPKPTNRNGKNPLLIFISSWGLNKWEYISPAHDYAEKGYTVVSYTSRGFWGSGGQINLAGSLDMADISTVIDWALANTNADPTRIGSSGISYGGGLSILGAAHDPRVKSAAAMSCWIDLAQSFLGNGESVRKEAARVLEGSAYITGEVGEDLELLFQDYFSNTDLDYLYNFVYNSSAVNFIEKINANNPAIFIANAFSDSLFTPDQFPERFYNKLTTNKRHLEFNPGDHAGPEARGLFGLPDQVWTRANQWNDYYVRDAKTDKIADMPSIILSNSVNDEEAIETYNTWEEVTDSFLTFEFQSNEHLSVSENKLDLHENTEEPLATIITGTNAQINGGVAFITATIRSSFKKPLYFNMSDITREYAAVFQTDQLSSTTKIRGTTEVNLNIIPKNSSNGTLVMYLLDVDNETNNGRLITFAPWTFKNTAVGQVTNLPMEITMTSYDLLEKHSLAMVIQSHDPLFLDQSPAGSEISFVSGTLSLPVHI
jgi:predicted acyl esterase